MRINCVRSQQHRFKKVRKIHLIKASRVFLSMLLWWCFIGWVLPWDPSSSWHCTTFGIESEKLTNGNGKVNNRAFRNMRPWNVKCTLDGEKNKCLYSKGGQTHSKTDIYDVRMDLEIIAGHIFRHGNMEDPRKETETIASQWTKLISKLTEPSLV